MIILLSPAKTLDFNAPSISSKISEPRLVAETSKLIDVLSKLSAKDLEELMEISLNLAELNYERFSTLKKHPSEAQAKQALALFKGEAYRGLNVVDFDEKDVDFAQNHLRILSGFYGVLRPLDLIQAHRLEMGTKLHFDNYKNLYQFWGDKISEIIKHDLQKSKTIINLASDEYFKAINKKVVNVNIITPKFMNKKNGKFKTIAVYAKNARGAMTSYIIKNRITNPEEIKSAKINNYSYNKELSDSNNWIFTSENN